MDTNEDSDEIVIRIYDVLYCDIVAKLRGVRRNTVKMKFIKGLMSKKEFFKLTLQTKDNVNAVSLYVRKDDLYVIAVVVRGRMIYEAEGYKEIAGSKPLPYGVGYGPLSSRVDFDDFALVWTGFQTAVEVLIQNMDVDDDKIEPWNWSQSLFIIIVTLMEGARNNVVAGYVHDSQNNHNPKTFMAWIRLLLNNWSRISDSARRQTSNVKINDLDAGERVILLGLTNGKTTRELLELLVASPRVCNAMLGILCEHPVRD